MFSFRTEAMEKQMQLRTKAMREKDELREMRKYRFALIRVRFPDGVFLQVIFLHFSLEILYAILMLIISVRCCET